MNKVKRNLLLALVLGLLFLGNKQTWAATRYTVVLDPGHGGGDSGCSYAWNGVRYLESTINLKIATYCASYLKANAPNLNVYMTRSTNVAVDLQERVRIAANKHADFLVSFHINDAGQPSTANGCMVLVSKGTYREWIAKKEDIFTGFVLDELYKLGLKNSTGSSNGRYYRMSTDNSRYPNGGLSDYYTIVCDSVEAGFPGVIIEHCFMSNYNECMNYLASDAALKRLGEADAKGIIAYFSSEAADPNWGKSEEEIVGWYTKDGETYYKDASGTTLKKQWLVLDGKRYYLTSTGARATGFVTISKKLYYFDEYGVAGKGRTIINGKIYVLTTKGAVRFGWYHTAADNYYYLYPKGHRYQGQALRSGSFIIKKKVYSFNSKGYCTNYHFAKKATSKQKKKLITVA